MRETWVRSLGWEDPLVKGKAYPLQHSGLENSMGSIVHGVAESDTTLHLGEPPDGVGNGRWPGGRGDLAFSASVTVELGGLRGGLEVGELQGGRCGSSGVCTVRDKWGKRAHLDIREEPPPGPALENQYLKAHALRLFAVDFVMEPLSPSSSAMILSEMLTGLFLCEQIALTELSEV